MSNDDGTLEQVMLDDPSETDPKQANAVPPPPVDDASAAPKESTVLEPEELTTISVADDTTHPSAGWTGTSIVESSAVTLGDEDEEDPAATAEALVVVPIEQVQEAREPTATAATDGPVNLPLLPSPFFPEPSSSSSEPPEAALKDLAVSREASIPTDIPTSQNGTPMYGLSPPSSPHPLDNPRPPTFLQVDASYRGLLYSDGYDTHGRPVIVLNTSALPPKARKNEALEYLKEQLSPVVNQGPYVLVLCNHTEGPTYKSLPSLWTVSAYRSLARPFHKNVKFIIMVNPSILVRAVLAVVKPFVKKKAYHKLKKVKVLADLDQVTNGEVRMEHLGQRFLATLQAGQAS